MFVLAKFVFKNWTVKQVAGKCAFIIFPSGILALTSPHLSRGLSRDPIVRVCVYLNGGDRSVFCKFINKRDLEYRNDTANFSNAKSGRDIRKMALFLDCLFIRELDEELAKNKSRVTYKTKKVQNDFLHPVK